MKFRAYSSCGESVRISYDNRDESAGILATVASSQPPTGESETREGIIEIAYAFLGRDPSVSIYVTDAQNQLLEVIFNEKYHKDLAERGKWHFMAWALLFLCLVCFLATVAGGLHWGGFALFSFIASLYIAFVQLGIQNEVESALACTIILILILVLVPAIRTARERNQRKPSAEQSQAQEPETGPVLPVVLHLDYWFNFPHIRTPPNEIDIFRIGGLNRRDYSRSPFAFLRRLGSGLCSTWTMTCVGWWISFVSGL